MVDDDVLLRDGLSSLLESSGFDVVGLAGNGTEALELARTKAPDLLVIDIRIPPTNTAEGLDVARVVRKELPETGILFLPPRPDLPVSGDHQPRRINERDATRLALAVSAPADCWSPVLTPSRPESETAGNERY